MRKIKQIVIHCSATKEGRSFTAADINLWHIQEGWNGMGYHFVILLDGTIETGRPIEQVGAHVGGFNSHSIGICYIGGYNKRGRPADTRTPAQVQAMVQLVRELVARFPDADVLGHRDFPKVKRDCPCFDVRKWWRAELERTAPFGDRAA